MSKTVIEMAREIWSAGDVYIGPSEKTLERFAELVRADAIAAEREACANLVFHSPTSDEYDCPLVAVYKAILARGKHD